MQTGQVGIDLHVVGVELTVLNRPGEQTERAVIIRDQGVAAGRVVLRVGQVFGIGLEQKLLVERGRLRVVLLVIGGVRLR